MTIAVTRQGVPVSKTSRPQAAPDGAVLDGTVLYLRIGDLELEIRCPSAGRDPRLRNLGDTQPGRLQRGADRTRPDRGHPRHPGRRRGTGLVEQLAGPVPPWTRIEYFVVSINILGGCYGSTVPSTPAPDGRPGAPVSRWSPCGTRRRPKPGWRTRWGFGAGTPFWAVRGRSACPGMGRQLPGPGPALRRVFGGGQQHC